MHRPSNEARTSGSTTSRRHPTSTSSGSVFLPFSAASSVDDTPAGGRTSRMCRTQRIRPSCCCTQFVRPSHSYCHPPDHTHCTHHHITCHYRPNRRDLSTAQNMTSTRTESVLPAPPVDVDEQRPKRRTLWEAVRKNCHWKCFVLTLMIDGCLAIILWCQWTQQGFFTHVSPLGASYDARKGACEQGYNFIPVAFAVMLYVVYIMECWHCRTRLDLLCKHTDTQSVYDYAAQLRDVTPVVWWRAVCYHYVRRTRQVTRYRNGDAITSTQVYYERVNSHTAGSAFSYQDCGVKDISKRLVDLERYPVTRLRFRKGFVFANLQSANEFEEQRGRFFQENEQRDDYMEVREGLDLVNVVFKENMIAFSDPHHRPWFVAQPTFWICSFFLLSWPLRVLIEYCTASITYQVTKLFGTNYLSPSSQNYTGPLTRVSTMDSGELESVLRNNYVIVPSYSEALLMDPAQGRGAVATSNGVIHIQTRPMAIGPNLDGHRFAFHSSRRLPADPTGDAILSNETVIANYGALLSENRTRFGGNRSSQLPMGLSVYPDPPGFPSVPRTDSSPLQQFIASAQRRSRSLSILLFRSRSSSDTTRHAPTGTPHSISIGSLAALAKGNIRRAYRTLPTTPDVSSITHIPNLFHDQIDEAPEEPPPSYDLALKLCQPVEQGQNPGTSSDRFKWFHNLRPPSNTTPGSATKSEASENEPKSSGCDTVL